MKKTKPAQKQKTAELPTLTFKSGRGFAEWLATNHAKSRGVWLKMARKASGLQSIAYAEALEYALCWGWIDSTARRVDDTWYVQKFTPRGKRSLWSKINCAKAETLIASGRMQPAGRAAVERAKQDGRWARAYDSPASVTVPDDLAAALNRNTRASAYFGTLDLQNRYAILHRIQTAKLPETRARRIATFIDMLAKRRRLYP